MVLDPALRSPGDIHKCHYVEQISFKSWYKFFLVGVGVCFLDLRKGSLDKRLGEVTSGGSRNTMCRTPSLASGSATEQTGH